MNIFEGKSPAERNKIIVALVLGVMALLAIGYNIVAFFPGSKTTVNVKISPTPTPAGAPRGDTVMTTLPSEQDAWLTYTATPVVYTPGLNLGGGAPGRNIFAFYEPPVPTPYSPTPYQPTPPPTPSPTPTPPMMVQFIQPQQNIYAGGRDFRLEVGGDKFTAETRIYFHGNELRTNFINAQRLTADVPAHLISSPGDRQIIVQTPDRKLYSNPVMLTVQPQPQPEFQYIGPIIPKRSNNVMAYIQEKGTTNHVPKRLGDIVGGRFRLLSIAPTSVVVEDISLGFRHTVELAKASGQPLSPTRPNQGFPNDGTYQPYPNMPNYNQPNPQGIPQNLPRYIPPNQNPNQNSNQNPNQKKDEDNDDEDGDN